MRPSTVDGELCMKHQRETGVMRLIALMAKHVDDLKLTGVRATVEHILQQLENNGQLKISWNNFTNCGVRHRQSLKYKSVALDQDTYCQSLRTISHV